MVEATLPHLTAHVGAMVRVQLLTAASLDYEVALATLATADGTPVPRSRAVVRSDTRAVLGVVSDRYVPDQNARAFGFLDEVVAGGGLRYHTAGALGRGERIFLLAKFSGHIWVAGTGDHVDKFLLLSNAHDGSAALRVLFIEDLSTGRGRNDRGFPWGLKRQLRTRSPGIRGD